MSITYSLISIKTGSLDYYSFQGSQPQKVQAFEITVKDIEVWFDAIHEELLPLVAIPGIEASDQPLKALESVLGQKWKLVTYPSLNNSSNEEQASQDNVSGELSERPNRLTSALLCGDRKKVNNRILVLAAPTCPLERSEVQAITTFVEKGGSLLVAVNNESLYKLQQDSSGTFNDLMATFGLKFKQLLRYPPDEILDFIPHYLSSEINRCFFAEPAYLEILEDKPDKLLYPPSVIARLPDTQEPCFVASEMVGSGRIVAISDYIFLTEEYLKYGNNRELVLNIFRWLASQNYLDLFDAKIDSEVMHGEVTTFSITLSNPNTRRIEFINCLLEAKAGVEVFEPQEKIIRSIAPYEETTLLWQVKPIELGKRTLKLSVESLKSSKNQPLFFDQVVQFTCVPNVEIDLVIQNHHDNIPERLEVGKPVEVKAVFRQKSGVSASPLQLTLNTNSSNLTIEPLEQSGMSYRWRLTPRETGEGAIALKVDGIEHKISRLIQVRPSIQSQMADIRKNILRPLQDEIAWKVESLGTDLSVEAIRQIPFQVCSPEDLAHALYSGTALEELLEVLRVVRTEKYENLPLLRRLLLNIAPTFLPSQGCLIPYDPDLANHLARQYPAYKDHLAQNFLCLDGSDEAGIKQNLASLILHEQYGHGSFFTHTTLGKQLAILQQHEMTRDADTKKMRSPYPRKLYEEYRTAIKALWDSTVIVNEGFATWLELTILPLLSGVAGQAVHSRRDFLFNNDKSLALLARDSEYFKHFPAFRSSRYQEGCELFQRIQNFWKHPYGIQSVVAAMIIIADIDTGIAEISHQIQIALTSEQFENSMLSVAEFDVRADERLRHLYSVLRQYYDKEETKAKKLQFETSFSLSEDIVSILMKNHWDSNP